MNLFLIAVIDVIVLALGIWFTTDHGLAVLSFAVPVIGIVTFFGFLSKSQSASSEQGIRLAITVALVTVYIVLVGLVSFFRGEQQMPEVAEALVGSFTATIGVVVAFYFGSSAYVEACSQRPQADDDRGKAGSNPPPSGDG